MYGHRALRRPTAWGVHFAGTETEAGSGHVDGAVAAGERAAREVLAAAGAAAAWAAGKGEL
jgi:monoamine oxidase